MKLTRAADFSIRLLTHLASKKDARGRSAALAEEIGVPLNHLAKLAQRLGRHGYLVTQKGKGGGLRLAQDPRRINLAEVIESVEGPLVLSDCLLNRRLCRFSQHCRARKCLGKVRQKMRQLLAATTIWDLIPERGKK